MHSASLVLKKSKLKLVYDFGKALLSLNGKDCVMANVTTSMSNNFHGFFLFCFFGQMTCIRLMLLLDRQTRPITISKSKQDQDVIIGVN